MFKKLTCKKLTSVFGDKLKSICDSYKFVIFKHMALKASSFSRIYKVRRFDYWYH